MLGGKNVFFSGFSFESVKNYRFTGEWSRCDAIKLKPQTHKTQEWYHTALTMSVLLSHIFLSVVRCASTIHAQLEHFSMTGIHKKVRNIFAPKQYLFLYSTLISNKQNFTSCRSFITINPFLHLPTPLPRTQIGPVIFSSLRIFSSSICKASYF